MRSRLMTALLGAVPAALGFQPAIASAHAFHAEHVLGATLDLTLVSATAGEAQTAHAAARSSPSTPWPRAILSTGRWRRP